jgi:hypothetical protein
MIAAMIETKRRESSLDRRPAEVATKSIFAHCGRALVETPRGLAPSDEPPSL